MSALVLAGAGVLAEQVLAALLQREDFLEAKGLSRRTAPLLVANGQMLDSMGGAPWRQLAMYAMQTELQRLQVRIPACGIILGTCDHVSSVGAEKD